MNKQKRNKIKELDKELFNLLKLSTRAKKVILAMNVNNITEFLDVISRDDWEAEIRKYAGVGKVVLGEIKYIRDRLEDLFGEVRITYFTLKSKGM